MSPDPDMGQQVPEELPHHTPGPQAGRHQDGEPFQDSDIEPDDNLHDAFEQVQSPAAEPDADDPERAADGDVDDPRPGDDDA